MIEINENKIVDEFSNGILFDTVQQSIQYIEDLFALIKAGQQKKYFIRDIVMYSAGKVETFIKNYKVTHNNLCNSFYFPDYEIEKGDSCDEISNKIYESLDVLKSLVNEIIDFYHSNIFFYNQYKHGLSIALRSFRPCTEEMIKADKIGEMERSPLIAYESLNFQGALKKKHGDLRALIVPLSDAIQQNIKKLEKDNNLLRYVFSSPDCNIERLVEIAEKTRFCMLIFITNILESVSGKDIMQLQLPSDKLYERIVYDIKVNE